MTTPRTVSITSPPPAYYRNQRPLVAVHTLAHELPDGSVVGTACGRTFAAARTHLTLDAPGAVVSCASCRRTAR